MAIYTADAEGGIDNAQVTGAPFAATSAGLKYHTGVAGDLAIFGNSSFSWENAGATDGVGRVALGDTSKVASIRIYARYNVAVASPLTALTVMTLKGAADATNVLSVYMLPTGFLRIGNSGSTNWWTSTAAVPIGVDIYFDVWCNTGTTATDGTAGVRVVRKSDGVVIIDSVAGTGSAAGVITNNFGAGAVLTNARVFKPGAEAYPDNIRWDALEIRTGTDSNGFIGAFAAPANTAPTISAPAVQNVAAGSTVNITFGGTDDSGIVSRNTTFDFSTQPALTISNPTTATPSFVAGVAGSLYIVRHRVTDAAGLFAETTTEVRVPLTTAVDMRPIPVTPSGSWVGTGGNAAVFADESDTTYYTSPTITATEANMRVRYQPSVDRANGTITLRMDKTDSSAITVTVRIYVGVGSNTVLESWSFDVTTSIADYTHDLLANTVSAITAATDGWKRVYVEIGVKTP